MLLELWMFKSEIQDSKIRGAIWKEGNSENRVNVSEWTQLSHARCLKDSIKSAHAFFFIQGESQKDVVKGGIRPGEEGEI